MPEKEIPGMDNIDKEPLMSNEQTINHYPDKFTFDFRGVYLQFAPGNQPIMISNHKFILLDPYMAKDFLRILSDNIKKYEENYGEIKIPEVVEKARKEAKKRGKEAATSTSKRPDYMG